MVVAPSGKTYSRRRGRPRTTGLSTSFATRGAWTETGGGRAVRESVVLDPTTLDLTVRPAAPDDRLDIDEHGAPRLADGRRWALETEERG